MKKGIKGFLGLSALGVLVGAVNGLFGAGGGMLAVPLLKKQGLSQKSAHANAIAVILPITAVSAVFYALKGMASIKSAYIYILPGLIGAALGTLILRKISPRLLKGIFGGFMVYAGARLLLK